MPRNLKFTDAELKNVIIDANVHLLGAIRNELADAAADPSTPTDAYREFKFSIELLDKNIAALNDVKENR